MKRILRLYPAAWRRRYGAELTDLLDEMPASPATTLDLVRGAATQHMRALLDRVAPSLVSAGGPPMPTHPLQRHATATALVAALIAAPTVIFVAVSFLAYQLELPGMQAWLQPFMDGLNPPRIVDLFLLGAPFLAFVVAALPLISLRMARVDGSCIRISLALRARTLNLVVMAFSCLVGGLSWPAIVVEFLFDRP